ncbi:MAG: peptide chain release factor N(5)-glutamine methyltransferase [Bacteroidetes bacterium]|nr:peptide chain release factor N(5)-glutamine methyltransferase [Bacteroidota bacterium]
MEASDIQSRLIQSLETIYSADEIKAIARWVSDELPADKIKTESWLNEVINRLKTHEPFQYILGYTWFYNRKIKVSPSTLIPRPETEEMCWHILQRRRKFHSIADVCTGSGCIATTLACEIPGARIIASDISAEALHTALENIQQYSLNERVECLQTDFLKDPYPEEKFDLIVSNPPYVGHDEACEMEKNVLDWEPHIALFPAGMDDILFYRRLCGLLQLQLAGTELWAEINPQRASALLELFSGLGVATIIPDSSGKDRFLHVTRHTAPAESGTD